MPLYTAQTPLSSSKYTFTHQVCAQTALGTSHMVVKESGHSGPRVVVVGGHHGHEPAGALAAGILAHLAGPREGSLLVIPQANPGACQAANREAPFWTGGTGLDLNRCYSGGGSPEHVHAWAILEAVLAFRPTLVLDLHESSAENANRIGADQWAYLDVAEDIPVARGLGLVPVVDPLEGTFTRAVRDRLGVPAFAVETRRDLLLRERVLRHLGAVMLAMESLELLVEQVEVQV